MSYKDGFGTKVDRPLNKETKRCVQAMDCGIVVHEFVL